MLDVLLISRNKDATWDISDVQLKKGDTLHGLYHHIGCNVVDIRCVNIKGIDFDIWFDDEFMLREEAPIPTMPLPNGDVLCGKVLIAKNNEDGDTIGLTAEEKHIFKDWFWHQVFE